MFTNCITTKHSSIYFTFDIENQHTIFFFRYENYQKHSENKKVKKKLR